MKRRLRRWWLRLWANPPTVIRVRRTTWDPRAIDEAVGS